MTETAKTETSTSARAVKHWQALTFRDPETMMTWLRAVGFVEHATYRDDHGTVMHAEWLWPDGGGIMFGSADTGIVRNAGGSAAYLITDDPDGAFQRAVAAGGEVIRAMEDQDYGGRGGSVADPEGNHWSFGDYRPG